MNANAQLSARPIAVVVAVWLAVLACELAVLLIDLRLADAGREDLQQLFDRNSFFFLIPIASLLVVGSALAIRRPRHPVGWLFLLVAIAIFSTGLMDAYAGYGVLARPGSLPGADIAAMVGASMYLPWLMLLGLVLLLTPGGRLTGRSARIAFWAMVLGAAVAFAAGMLRPYTGDLEPRAAIDNPFEISAGTGALTGLRWAGNIVLHLGLLAGAAATVLRFRRARARERLQLRWLGMTAIPFVVFVLGAFVAALLDNEWVLIAMTGGLLGIIPLAVGISIEQHNLYDVDRLVSRAVAWVLLTAAVIGTYVVVVVFVGESIGRDRDSAIPAVVATLAAALAAAPLRRAIQDGLDRRFNRRRFETLAVLRAFAREPAPSMTVEQALRTATGDRSLRVAYWVDERKAWVSEEGIPAAPDPDGVTVRRQGETVSIVGFDPSTLECATVEAAAAEVLTELENARLRAAITLQLVEVRESRARIVDAQLAERHRIERDLHDGAQQRLLGLAMQLRAVEMSGNAERMQSTVSAAVDELQTAVRELRELANGLRPAVLVDGGLAAALDDLSARSPVPVRLETTGERFATEVEETAWFIACEAVANAVKHASPHAVVICAQRTDGLLRLTIEDDGIGGADPAGSGLRGIADRAEAAGGTLSIQSRNGHGTVVIAELPCAS